ncbi:MAG TPA: histidine kinase [Longimicrobium sp.]|nr:histidine kinase [Longimicrobium sp.]
MSVSQPLPTRLEDPDRRRRWLPPAAIGAWLALNLLMLSGDFRGAVPFGGGPASPAVALLLALPSSLVLAAAGWAAFRLTRRHTVGRRGWPRGVGVHAAAALGFAALNTAVRMVERRFVAGYGPSFAAHRDAGEFVAVVMVYALLAVTAHALEYGRRFRRRELDELALQAELARAGLERAEAELRVLKVQLNPHFLFNSLHAVSALVHGAPDAAERMVVRLGDLLRQAVTRVGTQEVPLEEELRTLRPFLEVEEIRLGGRLRVEWEIEDDARGAWVPHMVLQPLVENAIKHGLAAREGGRLEVSARRRGPWLQLEVRDDGVGLAAAADRGAPGGGIGTANTRARLAQLYGPRHALEIAPAEGGGTRVSLRIPWHEAPWPRRALDGVVPEVEARSGRRWIGPAAALVFFLFLLQRGIGALQGRVLPGRVVGAEEAAVCGTVHAAALTLLVSGAFVLARRAPLLGAGKAAAVRRQLPWALALALGVTLERKLCPVLFGSSAAALVSPDALRDAAAEVALGVVIFAVVSAVAHALEYARRARVQEAAALRLQAALARAELERASAELRAVKMQVNPGFLFTALAAVASRVHDAPADAERMVVRLADLLREAMGSAEVQEVALEEEIRALEPFLEVERLRLDGLRVEMEIDDDALDAFVPHLLLQPLVAAAMEGGCVAVDARRRGEVLEIGIRGGTMVDGAMAEAVEGARGRLARLYGGGCAVEAGDGGARVVIRLPWHEEPWPAHAAAAREETVGR